jgi:hypothetical protein
MTVTLQSDLIHYPTFVHLPGDPAVLNLSLVKRKDKFRIVGSLAQ